jgi:hypothetical protein
MKTPNALNPGASSTAQTTAAADLGLEAENPAGASEQAYENSPPGALGNVPGEHKAVASARTAQAMMGTSKTDDELAGGEAGDHTA